MPVRFIGNCDFEDACQPFGSKDEWGLDILQRAIRGRADRLKSYMDDLRQGQTVLSHPGFHLQTWYADDNPVFPTVQLTYKGLLSGTLPEPFVVESTSERSGTITATVNGDERTYDFSYLSQEKTYRFVKNSNSQTADPAFSLATPSVFVSWYVGGDGRRKSGYPPNLNVTARVASRTKTPIFGTPYSEYQVVVVGIVE